MGLLKYLNDIVSRQPHPLNLPRYDMPITAAALDKVFTDCSDYHSRKIYVGGEKSGLVTVCYIEGVVDATALSRDVLQPLTDITRISGNLGAARCMELIKKGAVYYNSVAIKNTMDEVVDAVVSGSSVIVFDREHSALVFETPTSIQRSITEPTVEKAVNGSKDSFVERLRTNTTLVRLKLRTPELKIIKSIVGRRSDTEIAIMYIDGIANPVTVGEVIRRLNDIDIDGLLATGNIVEYISDNPNSPFPQILQTERPDRFAIDLLGGRVGMIIDGLSMAIMVPATLNEIMRVPEDYSNHYLTASLLLVLRYLAIFVAVFFPALYVATSMYHQEMIPLKLLLSIIGSKQQVPFSTAVEIIGMLVAFELLQEAGLRLPNSIGETVSIIGALVVGQSAVEAKVISPIAVIVVAVAGITGYTIPNQDLGSALRLCRFLMVILALLGGMLGIIEGLIIIVYHLSSLETFGVSYLSPLTDGNATGVFSMILRPPLPKKKLRDSDLNTPNIRKQR